MQKELHDSYKGRKIELSTEGYAASLHTRVVIDDVDVSGRVPESGADLGSHDLALVILTVRRLIDDGQL